MARKFVSASNQTGTATSAGLTYPFTLAHWFNISTLSGANQNMAMLYPSGASTNDNIGTGIDGSTGQAEVFCSDNLTNYTVTPIGAALSTGVWHHIAFVGTSSTNRNGYLDGSATPITNLANITAAQDTLAVGDFAGGSGALDGLLADVAIWNVDLTAGEINALASGMPPYLIRPSALIGYWPMWGLASPEPDLSGNKRNITLANAPPRANHAPVTLWTPKIPTANNLAIVAAPSFGWFSPLPERVPKPPPFVGTGNAMTMQVPVAATTVIPVFDAGFPNIVRRNRSVS